jgi:hypothetical protein
MNNILSRQYGLMFSLLVTAIQASSQYHPSGHRKLLAAEIPVQKAGSYARPGATYVLTRDISSATSTLFLGKDVVLDLNGYTVRYADGHYQHIPNSGFEEGLKGWDISKAPGARLKNTADVHVFLGKKLLSLQAGDEIRSPYVYLPVANRSYFAMCGITGRYYHDMKKYPDDEMKISLYVEDEKGHEITCMTRYADSTRVSCAVENKQPRLGGGFIYAHLNHLPAGRYRVRVKAVSDCLLDEIDIRPAMDVGISIIEKTVALAHYDQVAQESRPPTLPSFFDYTEDAAAGRPLSSLPQVSGGGTIVIRNGVIESAATGILSWGIQSSARNVKVILENVWIKTAGISSGAADISWVKISHCRFDADMPFLIQRHVGLCSVITRGNHASEIAYSRFYGGQGCLSVHGKYSLVHDNLFVNEQTETNHYCIMGTGDSSKVYNNRFEPRQGSGIYVSRYTEVFNNVFRISTSPPTCEYGREEYSTAAVRLGDYHARPGSPEASIGNSIHDNQIYITARDYPAPESYIPMAWGIFYSASGGENEVYRNLITVNKTDRSPKVKTAALYICGGPKYFGGRFYENRIVTNVPAAWVATMYGGASNSRLYNNTIIPLNKAEFKTFTIGFEGCSDCVARNVEFRSNEVKGAGFSLEATDQNHSYSVYWSLRLKLTDPQGRPLKERPVTILDRQDSAVLSAKTDQAGMLKTELQEYSVDGKDRKVRTPYTIVAGTVKKQIDLNRNRQLTWIITD